ncbi:hypothetical protein COO55_38340 [Rhodococcus opacus]|nr:transposase [Rhodococcus opacus]RKM64881.1 hypothetical protein COO55_38340 [Rhodococcus opacus]
MDVPVWTQMLAFTYHGARRWKPKRIRLRLFSVAGCIAHHGRRVHLRLSKHHSWSTLITKALAAEMRISTVRGLVCVELAD